MFKMADRNESLVDAEINTMCKVYFRALEKNELE